MKIKEIETLTNMSRDNIRFYEKCGLLIPNRNENGYREYSEEDVKTLKRIKLLRNLHLSIEEIKDIQTNKIDLVNHLDEHIKHLETEQINIEKSMDICKQLILDHVTYNDLDASKYLQTFDNHELEEDVIEPLYAPYRRFLARTIDFNFYAIIIYFIVFVIFNAKITSDYASDLLTTILTLITMLFIEPLLLSKLGTTLGKFILGLRVYDEENNLLTYKSALDRTLNIIIYGYGLNIPIISAICQIKTFLRIHKNKKCIWEEENIQILKYDNPMPQAFGVISFTIINLIISVLISNYSLFPMNRGDLTLKEFSENYNFIESKYGDPDAYLNESGNWEEVKVLQDGTYIVTNLNDYPKLNYVIRNNQVVEINFKIEENTDLFTWSIVDNIKSYLILSYLQAQESYTIFSFDNTTILKKFLNDSDYKYEGYGLEIIQDVEFDNSDSSDSANTIENYSMTFTIRKK